MLELEGEDACTAAADRQNAVDTADPSQQHRRIRWLDGLIESG
jgi:hypothetical protein